MKKQMNIVLTALSVITLMGVVSCKKVEELEGNGSTIRFGVSTIYENGPATKTEYSGKDQNNNSISSTSTAERIDWLATDKIRIQCAQASVEGSSDKDADYAITPGSAGSTQIHTATITPVGKGLQWGTGSHDFYALYPSTVQNSASTIAESGSGATVGGTIPATQTATKSGYIFKPDMDYAYMYAVKAGVSAGSSVSLDFHPLVTTLEFTLLTKAGDPITSKLTSVKLSSSQTTSYLTGTFTAELTTSGLTAVTMGDITSGGNEITITLPDGGVQLSTDPAEAYTVTFLTLPLDQTELTLTLGFADSSKRTLELKDNDSWITVDACKKTYIWKLDAPLTLPVSISGGTGMFGDIYLTNGILKKTDATFSIEEDPFVLCTAYGGTAPSLGSSSGTRYYFNYIELGQYFSNDPAFNENSGNIPAVQTVSYSGHDWRMPSQSEWAAATTTAGRAGSTVNGTSGARFALVLVDLTGSSYAGMGLTTSDGGQGTSTNYMAAMLLFPDGATVTCGSINTSCINNTTGEFATSTVSYADISTLVSGGCIVLPAASFYDGSDWYVGGTYGFYWSGTEAEFDTDVGCYLDFGNGRVGPDGYIFKPYGFFPVVLARGTAEISGGTAEISGGTPYKFGDVYLTNGLLKKTDATFSIEEDPFVLCTAYDGTAPSQGSSSGTRYYFNYIELGQYFSGDASFDGNSGNIPAVQTVSFNGQDWRMPSQSEWAAATTTAGRTGSTVNGTSGARFALVLVDLTGSSYAGMGLTSSDGYSMESNSNYIAALLLFPDGATVTCDSINAISINGNAGYASSTVSYADISTLVSGGCIVLPAAGRYNSSDWYGGGTEGYYWSGTEYDPDNGYDLYFGNGGVGPDDILNKSYFFFPVVLAREAASISGGTGMFGDAYLTNGILKKTDSTFSIEEDPFVLCTAYGGTAPSQGSSSGTRYYFNYIELGQYFSNDASFDGNSGSIPAVQTVSYNGQDWRMPSQSEWEAATTEEGRTGSTVNGTGGARFALVLVDLTGSVHAGEGLTTSSGGEGTSTNYMAALLLFPDGATVTCGSINTSCINNTTGEFASSTVSYSDISTLVSGGCIVLPAAGSYGSSGWYDDGGTSCDYWSGTESSTYRGYSLLFDNCSVYPDFNLNKSDYFSPVVLARGTTEISGGTGMFGDAYLTNGILKKTDSTFSIEEDPFVLCTAYNNGTKPSQGSSSGTRYYFNYIELGQYFSNNASFNGNSGNIPAVQTVSYNGHNWRMPSWSEWKAATTTAGRTGSTVNGPSGAGARYAKVLVDLTGSSYAGKGLTTSSGGEGTSTNYMAALLLFPDGATVTCLDINSSSINNSSASFATSTVSYADISTLVSGGCIVLPAAGGYYYYYWVGGGSLGDYWSGTEHNTNSVYRLDFDNGIVNPDYDYVKSGGFFPVVLAR